MIQNFPTQISFKRTYFIVKNIKTILNITYTVVLRFIQIIIFNYKILSLDFFLNFNI